MRSHRGAAQTWSPLATLFVTLPLSYLRSVVASVERSTAGRARGEMPPAMRRELEESGGPPLEL
jgi:hypothetical protein